jgi:quercetin dioxygenase-like cupin family protein
MSARHRRAVSLALLLTVAALLVACASQPPPPPYPAFIAVDELPDAFVAGLPGVRAKQLSFDPRSQRASYRVAIPPDWSFTTGAAPIHSVEIYVLDGDLRIGEFALAPGAYVYIPPGMSGVQMVSSGGAVVLQNYDEADPSAVIETPIVSSSELLEWQPQDIGVSIKELRRDPGSGARTWLMKIEPDAVMPLQKSSQSVEGYLVSGSVMWGECSEGESVTEEYLAGGYFHRPPGAVHGGPATSTASGATWFLRVSGEENIDFVDGCPAGAGQE